MSTISPLFEYTRLVQNQNAAEVTSNDALNRIEALAQLVVVNRTTSTPPGSPNNGDTYLVAEGGTGAWADKDGLVATYYDGWVFAWPKNGWRVFDASEFSEYIVRGVEATFTSGLTFNDNDPSADDITRSAGSWLNDGFIDGMFIQVVDDDDASTVNEGQYTADSATAITATIITLVSGDAVTDETISSGSVTIRGYDLIPAHQTLIGPVEHSALRSPLPVSLTPYTLISQRAYFLYLGQTLRPVTPQHIAIAMTTGASSVTNSEVGLFSSTKAPDRTDPLTLTKLVSEAITITAPAAVKRNAGFSTEIAAGTHLWAGFRVDAGTPGACVGHAGHLEGGLYMNDATLATTFAASTTVSAVIETETFAASCPAMEVNLD